jgi:mRNA-degrading endonuclease RelE of RelBE toxin-antitoxin system
MFAIKFTQLAIEDLQVFPKAEQQWIVSSLESQLSLDAAVLETEDRRRLHPNGPVEWEIRLGKVRVFYDVDLQSGTVKIEAVGKKFFI